MARPIDTGRRDALRAAAADYLLAHGLGAFSLRPLAQALGTSARMLMHHFGTRDALLRQAVEEIRAREQREFAAWQRRHADRPATAEQALQWHWRRLTAPRMRPRLRQLFELYVAALGDPHAVRWLIEAPLGYWLRVLAAEHGTPPRASAPAHATLILATLRGLLLDLAASGDVPRSRAALELFINLLRSAPRTRKKSAGQKGRRGNSSI